MSSVGAWGCGVRGVRGVRGARGGTWGVLGGVGSVVERGGGRGGQLTDLLVSPVRGVILGVHPVRMAAVRVNPRAVDPLGT